MKQEYVFGVAVGFCTGAVFGLVTPVSYPGCALPLVLAGALWVVWMRKNRSITVVATCITLAACAVGMARATWVRDTFDDQSRFMEAVEHEGVVVGEPERGTYAEYVDVYDRVIGARIRMQFGDPSGLQSGDMIRYSAQLHQAKPFSSAYGRVFDYARFLRARHVVAIGEDISFTVVGDDAWYRLARPLREIRRHMSDAIGSMTHEPEAGLAQAMALGMRDTLDERENRVFVNTGLVHIVVLSGYHIMTLFAVVVALGSGLFGYRLRYVVAGGCALALGVAVGMTPTVARAILMALCVMTAMLLSRGSSPLRALVITGLLLVWYAPYGILYDPGFQLSFLATLGIVLVAPICVDALWYVPARFGLREMVAATIATSGMVLPFAAYAMGQFPFVGLIANLLVLPVVPYALLATFFALGVWYVAPGYASLAGDLVAVVHAYILHVAHMLARMPYASVVVPEFSIGVLAVVYGGVALGVYAAWYRWGGMPRPRTSSSAVDVSTWVIEDIDAVRRRVRGG